MIYQIIVESDSPIRVVAGMVQPPPPAPPPPPPPLPPPPTGEPFQWPPEPFLPSRDDQRYAAIGSFYAGEQQFTNPLPQSHRFAGYIEAHAFVGGWDLYAFRLWAPRDANPDLIRQVLRTGRV